MGKKESWFHALSGVARPDRSEKKNTKKTRKLQLLFWKQKSQELDSSGEAETTAVNPSPPSPKPEVELDSSKEAETAGVNPAPPSPKVEVELVGPEIEEARDGWAEIESENEDARNAHSATKNTEDYQDMHGCSVAVASADAADVVVAAGEADAEVAQLATASRPPVKSKRDAAAFLIQSFFRGYMARRSFRAEKGSTRLKTLVRGQSVKRQATTTLKCMQTMARVQHQVCSRQIRISKENQAFQRQLEQKHDLEKSNATMEDNWNDSTQSKEQVEEKRKEQQKAAIKRERALAYAYTYQQTWRNSPKPETQTLMDQQWGWNWVEKWMATRPWENKTMEESNSEPPSAKSVTTLAQKVRRDLNLDQVKSSASPKTQTRTLGRLSVSSPRTPKTLNSASAGRMRVPNCLRRSVSVDNDEAYGRLLVSSPRTTQKPASAGRVRVPNSLRRSVSSVDDDEAYGRPRIATPKSASAGKMRVPNSPRRSVSSVDDDDTKSVKSVGSERHRRQASCPVTPNLMTRTNSAKEKSRSSMEKSGTPEKDSTCSEKKRLPFAVPPPAQRRHSEPLKTSEVH